VRCAADDKGETHCPELARLSGRSCSTCRRDRLKAVAATDVKLSAMVVRCIPFADTRTREQRSTQTPYRRGSARAFPVRRAAEPLVAGRREADQHMSPKCCGTEPRWGHSIRTHGR
jgi:hypothetical protein